MASAKQIAWRKKFAKLAKSGKFKKKSSSFLSTKTSRKKTGLRERIGGKKYMIIRFFRDENTPSKVIRRNLTLAQARKHTNDPATMKKGVWFDGYDEQDETMIGGSSHGIDKPDTGDW